MGSSTKFFITDLSTSPNVSLDGWLTTVRFSAMFERRSAQLIGVKHLTTVNSLSSAHLLAFSTMSR